jgi:glutamate-1-semialdehyde 2,1-aminomutase
MHAPRNTDLDTALAEARRRFVEANPASRAAHAAALAAMPGGNTRTVLFYTPFPLAIVRGQGATLTDADGHDYVDFLGEYTAALAGHSHPAIRRAIERALDGGLNLSGHTVVEARFAAALRDFFPSLERVRFTNSGTEANLLALSLARAATGRRKIMAFDGAYHGGLLYFGGGGSPVNAPYEVVLGRYNDPDEARRLIAAHGDDLAAIIVEPMIGSGGAIPGTPDFLAALRGGADAAGAILIFDEVMTSRLAPGGLQAALGLRADLTTLGKYIGGGMSFGAFGGRADLMDRFDPRRPDALPHAGTFNNNVLTMHAGLAALTEVLTPAALAAVNARGEALRRRLDEAARAADAALRFTGRGSIMAAHFTRAPIARPADTAGVDPRLRELFHLDLLAAGLYIARRGMITVNLPIGDAETERLVGAVARFLDERRPLLADG